MTHWKLGIVGGSGLYELPGLEDRKEVSLDTPWGVPSDSLVTGRLGKIELVFLPRHGRGHRLTPSTVPYRANIAALKMLGCTDVLSISACGSLQEQYAPGHIVAVDQFIDRTFAREKTFFGPGMVAHVSMAEPVSARLSGLAADAVEAAGGTVHRGGTYLCMEGPQFSTLAESRLYRQWGCDVIGMTNMPEAKLAREAELPYATLAMVTDYDCWRAGTDAVTVTNVMEVMAENTALARKAIAHLCARLSSGGRTQDPAGIENCLDFALITSPPARDSTLLGRLQSVAGRALKD
jgi:5'-methylthioadenosine phosphorylase